MQHKRASCHAPRFAERLRFWRKSWGENQPTTWLRPPTLVRMLELRPTCELCTATLDPAEDRARICTYECTFCDNCATWELLGVCPNCGGELVTRPRRPVALLPHNPPSATRVENAHDVVAHQANVVERLRNGDLPTQLWNNVFVNQRSTGANAAHDGYTEMANEMERLASRQPGFVAVDSARRADGVGITVSQWSSLAAMIQWRRVEAHTVAQRAGREGWYEWYRSDVTRVDRSATFGTPPTPEVGARPH